MKDSTKSKKKSQVKPAPRRKVLLEMIEAFKSSLDQKDSIIKEQDTAIKQLRLLNATQRGRLVEQELLRIRIRELEAILTLKQDEPKAS